MKRMNKNVVIAAFLALFLGIGNSCADLEVENLMNPDREEALASGSDIMSLLTGGYDTGFWELVTWRGSHNDGLADQFSVTNAWSGYWFFCQEPRNRFPNTTTWSDRYNIEHCWREMNQAVSVANEILKTAVDEGNSIIDEDTDIDYTDVAIASAYFLKGLAQGYIGMVYDKAYLVDTDTDLATLEYVDYEQLIDAGVANLKAAWEYAAAHPFDLWVFMVGATDYDSDDFIKIAKSFAARIMAGQARTAAEAATLDWATIKSYASGGLTEDFNPIATTTWWQSFHDWTCYFMGMKAPYLQVDIKIPYFFTKYFPEDAGNMYTWEDNAYPWEYPGGETVLGPAASKDARLGPRVVWYDAGESYWGVPTGEDTWDNVDPATLCDYGYFCYTPEFGYLNPARGRHLFSNYTFIRFQETYWPAGMYGQGGQNTYVMLKWEMDLLQAEAELHLTNEANAQDVINNATPNPREDVGMLPPLDGTYTVAEMIEYEYAIELYGTSGYINWVAMRRWDRLKKGTPLNYPVPASELMILEDELYTFGGSGYADGVDASTGTNAWAPLHGEK